MSFDELAEFRDLIGEMSSMSPSLTIDEDPLVTPAFDAAAPEGIDAEYQTDMRKANVQERARKALIAHFLKTEAAFLRDEGNHFSTMAFHHGMEHQRFSNRDRQNTIAGVSDLDAKPEAKFHKLMGSLFAEMGDSLHKFAVECDPGTRKF